MNSDEGGIDPVESQATHAGSLAKIAGHRYFNRRP